MGTHPIFESDFDCLTEMPSTPDLSDAELLAEYAKRKLERNGVCENGYDLMKGFGIGLVVGTVRKSALAPVIFGFGAGIMADSYFHLPDISPTVNSITDQVKEIFK